MMVLIVESSEALSTLWRRHLERLGHTVCTARSQADSTDLLQDQKFSVIVLDLVLEEGSAIAVADFASYCQPAARVVFVTNTSFFSDGSIFNLCNNACAFLPSATAPKDLAFMIEHYAEGANPA